MRRIKSSVCHVRCPGFTRAELGRAACSNPSCRVLIRGHEMDSTPPKSMTFYETNARTHERYMPRTQLPRRDAIILDDGLYMKTRKGRSRLAVVAVSADD